MQLKNNLHIFKVRNILLFFTLLSVTILLTVSGCGEKTIQSRWTKQTILIDGTSGDWQDIPLQYNEEMRMVYGIANDGTHLNLMIRFQDQRLARKMNARGLFLWIDANGKKRKKWGIRYLDEYAKTLENERLMSPGENQRFQQSSAPDSRSPVRLNGNLDLLLGDEDQIPVRDINGVEAAAGVAEGNYCFEFRIPLRGKNASAQLPKISAGQTLKTGLEIGAVDEEVRAAVKERIEEQMRVRGEQGGAMQPGTGRRGGQGMRAGGVDLTSFRNSMLKNLEGQELWVTVQLAKKPAE